MELQETLEDESEERDEIAPFGESRPKWWYAQQMRLAGANWLDIAHALGYSGPASAHRAVEKKRYKASHVDALHDEIERLDALQLICWKKAETGDLAAIKLVIAIIQTRARLLGLDTKTAEQGQTTNNTQIIIGGSTDNYLDALKRAREQVMTPKIALEAAFEEAKNPEAKNPSKRQPEPSAYSIEDLKDT
jgi:hypothetical protein